MKQLHRELRIDSGKSSGGDLSGVGACSGDKKVESTRSSKSNGRVDDNGEVGERETKKRRVI